MSPSSAAAFDRAPSTDTSTDKSPTRPLPKLTLEEVARCLDQAVADEDVTVTVSPEENKKLLASSHEDASGHEHDTDDEPTLDAPAPASSPEALAALALAEATPRAVRIRPRPSALRTLVITRPASMSATRGEVAPAAVISPGAVPTANVAPAPVALPSFPRTAPSLVMSMSLPAPAPETIETPPSGLRRKTTPAVAQTARDLRVAQERRRKDATFAIRLPKLEMETYVVAGIWAMALALFGVLMFMVTSA